MNNTLDQLKNVFLNYIRNLWDYTMEDIDRDMENDYLTEHETDDGRTFLHYYDGSFEFVILPDGVLDNETHKFQNYAKYIY